MTIEALKKEVLELPPRSRVRFVQKIIESVDDFTDSEIEKAWAKEISLRAKEIASGKVRTIPSATVMKNLRLKLNEARRLSSARRK